MKIALYIEDGLEQIVLTPQTETEKALLGKLHDGSRITDIRRGSFYECLRNHIRYQPGFQTHGSAGDESTMIVLRKPEEGEAA